MNEDAVRALRNQYRRGAFEAHTKALRVLLNGRIFDTSRVKYELTAKILTAVADDLTRLLDEAPERGQLTATIEEAPQEEEEGL